MKQLKRLAIAMLLVAVAHATFLLSCKKQPLEPDPVPTIEGQWKNLTNTHPDWQYIFKDNILTQFIIDFGDTITVQEYTYATRSDTLYIGGNVANTARTYRLTFHCDSVLQANNITPGVMLAPVLYLKRQKVPF